MSDTRESDALVGRDDEAAELRAALARARDGTGGLVALCGEPGIGKSALGRLTAAEAGRAGFEVAVGRSWDLDNTPRYFPLRPCLRALGIETHPALEAAADDAGVFNLWEEVLGRLARAAEPPRLWIVEDVHAADTSTLDLLLFLARSLRATRTLVVITARDRDPRLGGAVGQRVSRLLLDGQRIALGPLVAEAATALAARWGRGLGASEMGFWDGASTRVWDMLRGRDVSQARR